jgi:hypothetical protein
MFESQNFMSMFGKQSQKIKLNEAVKMKFPVNIVGLTPTAKNIEPVETKL